ncbi:MAG: NADP-dependent malic enzyme, partial [Kiritimatiellae bacterium]|nr:NADP-dependent malic enzyme [Kiritimatiellia bacterium]
KGVIYKGRPDLSGRKLLAAVDTPCRTLEEILKGADVFIGVSVAGAVSPEWVPTMAENPAIFALANPDPEITPAQVAAAMGDKPYVMATGRSDYPNQINNVLCFPFLFRGALDVRARKITMGMKIAAADALAAAARIPADDATKALYAGEALSFGPKYILPKPFDRRLCSLVAPAVAAAAVREGVARVENFDEEAYRAALAKESAES